MMEQALEAVFNGRTEQVVKRLKQLGPFAAIAATLFYAGVKAGRVEQQLVNIEQRLSTLEGVLLPKAIGGKP